MTLKQLDGSSRLYCILGDPIAQVKSPQGVTEELQTRGHNALLVPTHVSPAHIANFIQGVSLAHNIDGLIITVPHKFAARSLCAQVTSRAEFLGAVNVMRRTPEGLWYGDQVDGLAFVSALHKHGFKPHGCKALLAGVGGAGSAIAEALLQAGVASLYLHDEDQIRCQSLQERLAALSLGDVQIGSRAAEGFDLVINATPSGMREGDSLPLDPAGLTADTMVGDVITMPEITPWLQAAHEKGCHYVRGIDMFAEVRTLMVDFLLEASA